MATPDRHWPPRLRRALRDRLGARGLHIPKGLVIQYNPKAGRATDRMPWITVMHRPGRSETCSVHDTHLPFRGEDDVGAVVDMAERHALAMLRRDARDDALEAGGHEPRRPPMHMTEATPLVALAVTLVEAGLAGLDGEAHVDNGELHLTRTTIATPSGRVRLERGRIVSFESEKVWPATVLAGLTGKPLSDAVSLPASGRKDVDAAVAGLRIRHADSRSDGVVIEVEPARLLPTTAGGNGDDRRWLTMEPCPVG